MKKLLFSTLILMSATNAIIAPPAVKPVAAVAPVAAAPVVAASASLADQIKAILAQIAPGLVKIDSKVQSIKDAFSALETGLIGEDKNPIDPKIMDLNTKKVLVESCNLIDKAVQGLIDEIDPGHYPYWMITPTSITIKDLLEMQSKIATYKESIEGQSNLKMIMNPLKKASKKSLNWACENKLKTAGIIITAWILHKNRVFADGIPYAYENGTKGLFATAKFIFMPIEKK